MPAKPLRKPPEVLGGTRSAGQQDHGQSEHATSELSVFPGAGLQRNTTLIPCADFIWLGPLRLSLILHALLQCKRRRKHRFF